MANKNQKNQNQPEQQSTPQPTAPATPVELSDAELEQVVGGAGSWSGSSGGDHSMRPDPTAVQ